ncbi:unnamed protein product [Notodromas monacha]|uniref:Uncharacterized protein n=1 Tax=Notodromas monacha TaxID=399045 RepID=A0A7R9BXZ0_9CRUS|nr:unnamed protein product [Notodromas monacha]CAG0923433.1 unnamed protein product [Notodromas monacha]
MIFGRKNLSEVEEICTVAGGGVSAVLKPDDPILKALETHLESVTEFVTKVGVETDDAFDRSPVDQQQLDALFSAAQETVVVDAMGTSGKIFGAAMSAQRRRSNLTRVLAPAAAENAVEPDEESPGMEKLCLAAEYYTKLFKKISGEESGKNLNLLCLLIDKIGTLTNEISKSQPGKASEILANSNLTDIDIPLDEADDFPEEDSEAAPKFKYVPLDKSEILSTIAEVLPSLIVAKKLRPEASSGSLQNGGDARISEDWTLNDSITDLSQNGQLTLLPDLKVDMSAVDASLTGEWSRPFWTRPGRVP